MDFQNDWNSAVISAAAADVHKFKDEKKESFLSRYIIPDSFHIL